MCLLKIETASESIDITNFVFQRGIFAIELLNCIWKIITNAISRSAVNVITEIRLQKL